MPLGQPHLQTFQTMLQFRQVFVVKKILVAEHVLGIPAFGKQPVFFARHGVEILDFVINVHINFLAGFNKLLTPEKTVVKPAFKILAEIVVNRAAVVVNQRNILGQRPVFLHRNLVAVNMQNRHKHKGNHANREDNVNPRIVFNNLKPGQILDQLITNHVGKRDDDDKELAVKTGFGQIQTMCPNRQQQRQHNTYNQASHSKNSIN